MIGMLAQSVSDISVGQEVSKRLDLVGLFVVIGICLWRKIIVMGWTYEATEVRLVEATKLQNRLIEMQMRTLEAANARREV